MRCREGSRGGHDDDDDAAAGASDRGSWVARATSFSRSALHASTPAGIGAWWNGDGFGGGGGNNGTDGGIPTGSGMDEGGDSGEDDVNVYGSSFRSSSDGPSEVGFRAPMSTPFEPWMWLSAMWGLYVAWLRRSPLLAKALTSGVLGLGGDMAAQFFEFQQQGGGERKGPFVKVS